MEQPITIEEQATLDAQAVLERIAIRHVQAYEVSYDEKRGEAAREADKRAGIEFALDAGQYLASLGVKFAYKVPNIFAHAAKYRE